VDAEIEKLMACGVQGAPARVVSVSSSAHQIGAIDLQDLNYKHGRKYGAWTAYGARTHHGTLITWCTALLVEVWVEGDLLIVYS
jgi:hypothetical protein